MKRLFILGLLIAWSVFVFGSKGLFGSGVETIDKSKLQERNGIVYKIGSDKPFTGRSVANYKNGQKRSEENYKNGKKHGKTIWWNKNGQKQFELNYKDGKKHGKFIEWDKDGKIVSEKNYKNGVEIKEIDEIDFKACEETSQLLIIGNVSKGYDWEKINVLENEYLENSKDCLSCWAISLCKLCWANIYSNKKYLDKKEKK